MERLPKEQWTTLSHRMILHGRTICIARGPKCDVCPLGEICPRIGVEPKRKAESRKRRTD
jgi:endonuclease-3